MFGYVRLCSLNGKIRGRLRQWDCSFSVRARGFKRWLAIRRAGRHGSTAGEDARRYRKLGGHREGRKAEYCAYLRLIALNFLGKSTSAAEPQPNEFNHG
jgi:hypothetical protein